MSEIVLASTSPRRHQLLRILGVAFRVVAPEIDEKPVAGEAPSEFAERIAMEKAARVSGRVRTVPVLAADTVVSIDGRILGKPGDRDQAARMLGSLSGRVHSVYTAVILIHPGHTPQALTRIEETRVWFRPITDREIGDYLDREWVMDKAGAYAIQGRAAGFVLKLVGNHSNVVGLPLPTVYDMLRSTIL